MEMGYKVEVVDPGSPADLYVGYDPPLTFEIETLTLTHFVPVVSYWLPVTEVAYADLERIFKGEVQDWAELGAPQPAKIVPLALQSDPSPPLQPYAMTPLPSPKALAAALAQWTGGIALVSREAITLSMRVLRVDGRDPLLQEPATREDPLMRRLVLGWNTGVSEQISRQVRAVAHRERLLPKEPMIEVVVVGDVMPGRAVGRRILEYGGDYTRPFARIAPWLRQADLTIVNLEGALSDEIMPPDDPTTFYFVGSGAFCEGLVYAGVDGASLANNHSMNFGQVGMQHTLALLEESGIVAFGAGMDLNQARRPALFEVEGVRFAFLGYDGISHELYGADAHDAGTAPAYADLVMTDIAAARELADVVIPYFHWGWEYTSNPSPWQQEMAHLAVQAGADVVLGSHPHWVQGLERYQGVAILYSLGNFVFDQMWSIETRRGVVAHLVFRGDRLVNVRFQVVQIEDYHQPVLLSITQAQEVYRQMQAASQNWPH
jgi:poly-gamma-glutamate synthesis protein (capsule biosynthesis protein)